VGHKQRQRRFTGQANWTVKQVFVMCWSFWTTLVHKSQVQDCFHPHWATCAYNLLQ